MLISAITIMLILKQFGQYVITKTNYFKNKNGT